MNITFIQGLTFDEQCNYLTRTPNAALCGERSESERMDG